MHARWWLFLAVSGLVCGAAGCLNVQAPREVNVGSRRPERVDSGRVPRTSSHDECRSELEKAYQNIQYLERKNSELEEKLSKCKREKDKCEDELEKCKDRLHD